MDRELRDLRLWGSLTDLRSGVDWTPDEIAGQVAGRTRSFADAGLVRGDHAFILHDSRAHFLADLLGIWALGAWAVCIDPQRPAAEVRALADEFQPTLIVDAGQESAALAGGAVITSPEILPLSNGNLPAGGLLPAVDSGVVLLSSGTTGTPKAIPLSYRAICKRISLNRQYMKRAPRRTLCPLPTHFGHGLIGNCLTPWSAGSELFLADGSSLAVLASLGRIIDEHRIDFMSSVPSIWRIALELSKKPERQTLSRVHIGSAPLSAALWRDVIEWCGTRDVVNTYGLTETANWVAGASASEFAPRDGLVGRTWGGRAAVRKPDGTTSEFGEGEILLRVPTATTRITSATDADDPWLRTGDVGSIDADGAICILGRVDHVINRAGIKIQPEEIERLAAAHPAVAECCAFAAPHAQAGHTVAIAVRLRRGEQLSENAFRAWCARCMRPEAVPEHICFVGEMPVNSRGKLDRRALARKCPGPEQSQPGDRPSRL